MSQTKIKAGGRWVEWKAKANERSGKIRTHLSKFSDIIIVSGLLTLSRVTPQHDQRFADRFAKEYSVTWRFVDPPLLSDVQEVPCGRNVLGAKPAVRHQSGCKRCRKALGRTVPLIPPPVETPGRNGNPPVLSVPEGYVNCRTCSGEFGKTYTMSDPSSPTGGHRVTCTKCGGFGYVKKSQLQVDSETLVETAGPVPVAASAQPARVSSLADVKKELTRISDEAMELAGQAESMVTLLDSIASIRELKMKVTADLLALAPTVQRLMSEAGIDLEESKK
jgi:hypothetical protein